MHVWNVLHPAGYRTQRLPKKSPFGRRRTTLSGYIFTTKAGIDNWKKNLLNSSVSPQVPQYSAFRPTSGWDPLASLVLQRVSWTAAKFWQAANSVKPLEIYMNNDRHVLASLYWEMLGYCLQHCYHVASEWFQLIKDGGDHLALCKA